MTINVRMRRARGGTRSIMRKTIRRRRARIKERKKARLIYIDVDCGKQQNRQAEQTQQ